MRKRILVIDDEREQANALAAVLGRSLNDAEFMVASSESEIEEHINGKFYNLAILDIRMDDYQKSGIDWAKEIIEVNPFAKILFVSKFLPEYLDLINDIMSTGRILAFSEKKEYTKWMEELVPLINSYYKSISMGNEINKALVENYALARNETDATKKGAMFENFVALLFNNIGYEVINKRVRDVSLNEVDLIIRNEIDDSFLEKFGKYILVECKNKPEEPVCKNDFIVFQNKLDATNGLATLGFLFTTSKITRNTYIEAVRESKGGNKVIFVDNGNMERMLTSPDMKEELKRIIDSQVKDN